MSDLTAEEFLLLVAEIDRECDEAEARRVAAAAREWRRAIERPKGYAPPREAS